MKVSILVLSGLVLTVFNAALATPFTWAGWNYGVAPATNLNHVNLLQAACISLFLSGVAALFKTSLTLNEVDQQQGVMSRGGTDPTSH